MSDSRPLFKMPHEECGSSDALQVFEDKTGKHTGYCFSCGTYVADPLGDAPKGWRPPKVHLKTDEEVAAELEEIRDTFPTLDHPERCLKKRAFDYFGVKHSVSTVDGVTLTATFFPYTKGGQVVRYKVKAIDKQMWHVGRAKEWEPFGWQEAVQSGAKTLFITEGEHDAVALYQALKKGSKGTPYAEMEPAIISVTNGASGAMKELSKFSSEISKRFAKVVLVFDTDDAGTKAAGEVSRLLNATVATIPGKDPNECLIEGKEKALFKAARFGSVKPKKSRLIRGSQLRDAARKEAEWGMPWPWDWLTQATRGRRRGETIYFGAGVKMGKSELVNALAKQIIVDDGLPCLLIKPEEATAKTYQKVVGKAAGKIFHDPKIPFDYDAYDEYEPLVGDKAVITDIYQFVDWETTKADILEAVNVDGVKDVIIDPITCFTNTMSASEANEFLTGMASELSAMAKDHDFTAYIFCHLKAPTTGDSHENGGRVLSSQFAGSRAMMRSCNYMIGMEGNKDPDLPDEERNIRSLVILEDREFGNTGRCHLLWDRNTGLFKEID